LYSTVSKDEIVQADDDVYNTVVQLRVCNQQKSDCESEIKKLKLQLMTVLEDKQVLEYNGRQLVSWKPTKEREYFDKESFKKEHPEIYSEYVSMKAGSRRFVIKKEL
jgi:hypothetical protein